MISKKVPHTYKHGGIRYYAFQRKCQTRRVPDDPASRVMAYHFFIFDEYGHCWLQITHTTQSFINQLGGGGLQGRTILEVEDETWENRPRVDTNQWIENVPDRGYAIEIIREGLGLNLAFLKPILSS